MEISGGIDLNAKHFAIEVKSEFPLMTKFEEIATNSSVKWESFGRDK